MNNMDTKDKIILTDLCNAYLDSIHDSNEIAKVLFYDNNMEINDTKQTERLGSLIAKHLLLNLVSDDIQEQFFAELNEKALRHEIISQNFVDQFFQKDS